MTKSIYIDHEFGEIQVFSNSRSTTIKLGFNTNGLLKASLPKGTPIKHLQQLIDESRVKIRNLVSTHQPKTSYHSGMTIGKSHTLIVASTGAGQTLIKLELNRIIASLETGADLNDTATTRHLKPMIIKALRKEAKAYLPRRLAYLASVQDCEYKKVHFSHAISRWGSYSSNGTISLNIALMKLPFELIDYVLTHELSHTKELNHSKAFWRLVEQGDTSYKLHRKLLKSYSPII